MSRQVVFRHVARNEYDAAIAWYERERAGLGLEFQTEIDAILARIAANPLLFRVVRGPFRKAIVHRFPYTVHFLDEGDRVVVLAVFHAARNPRELDGRR